MKKSFHNGYVRKVLYLYIVGLLTIFFLVVVVPAYAHHRQEVLGVSTSSSELQFPAVTYGPGYILPDSPFYILDQTVQRFKLLLAFTPEQKAKIHAQIAGERLAELRIMFSRNDQVDGKKALDLLEQEMIAAANNLKEAVAAGKDVQKQAEFVNDNMKIQRDTLGMLSSQATGDLKFRLEAARETVKQSKVKVEDELPGQDLQGEIQGDIEAEIDHQVDKTSDSVKGLEHSIDVLNKLASEAAKEDQTHRAEALQKAIEVKNDALLKEKEHLLSIEENNKKQLIKERTEKVNEAKKAIDAIEKNSEDLKNTNDRVNHIENATVIPVLTPTTVPHSSNAVTSGESSHKNGSGSTNSGSSGSSSGSGGSDDSDSGSSGSGKH